MAEEMAIAIAEGADLVLNGYAVTRSEGKMPKARRSRAQASAITQIF